MADSPPPDPPPETKELETYYLPIYVLTAMFGTIFIIGPLVTHKCANKGIIRCCIMLSMFCMWMFWVTIYISQMNPLVGPRLSNTTAAWLAYKWGDPAQSETS